MTYQVRISPKARKELLKIPNRNRERIVFALIHLQEEPFSGKSLKGKFEGFYSLRSWPYRIIYSINKSELLVWVIHIGHRQGVYNF